MKRHRQKMGISQEEFADRAELDRTYVSQIERGVANPSLLKLYNIATALEVDLNTLLKHGK